MGSIYQKSLNNEENDLAEKLSDIVFPTLKPSIKGKVRLNLRRQSRFLREALRQGVTLASIQAVLHREGIITSVSSLRRYLLSEMAEEYSAYLQLTSRGFISNRSPFKSTDSSQFKKADQLREANTASTEISTPAEIREFLQNNNPDDI